MYVKKHLCGIFIAYPEACGKQSGKLIHGQSVGRDQGSHYNQQKRQIADGVARLQQLQTDDCKTLIMVATSPGYLENANEPKFISKLVTYLRNGFGMERYLWVREYTRKGFPHFHFAANIPLGKKSVTLANKGTPITVPFDPVAVSKIWSGYFDQNNLTSIRLGSKPNKYGRRMFYLGRNTRKAWYLAKYIGKSRGKDESVAKGRLRAFSMDDKTSAEIEPQIFQSKYVTECKVVSTWNAQTKKMEYIVYDIPTGERIFEDENGNLFSPHGIDWRSVGHDVFVGFSTENDTIPTYSHS